MRYRDAGVNIETKERALRGVREAIRTTFQKSVFGDIGGFGGLFELKGFKKPVLVSSVDGVGTKLKVAFLMNRHETVGQDIVHHCINDILTTGAEPLFFLDYIATGKLESNIVQEIIRGISKACRDQNCSLIGGETAEMPGFYQDGEYDLVGFILGVVEKERIIDRRGVRVGDQVIGLPSSGLHTNGYSLARKILFERKGLSVQDRIPGMKGTVGEELLRIHRCYAPNLLPLLKSSLGKAIKGIAHITGGGFLENIPRVLPLKCGVKIRRDSWSPPRIFTYLQEEGRVPEEEMFRTFNMGIGLILIVESRKVDSILKKLKGENPIHLGEVVPGQRRVEIL